MSHSGTWFITFGYIFVLREKHVWILLRVHQVLVTEVTLLSRMMKFIPDSSFWREGGYLSMNSSKTKTNKQTKQTTKKQNSCQLGFGKSISHSCITTDWSFTFSVTVILQTWEGVKLEEFAHVKCIKCHTLQATPMSGLHILLHTESGWWYTKLSISNFQTSNVRYKMRCLCYSEISVSLVPCIAMLASVTSSQHGAFSFHRDDKCCLYLHLSL